jgi:murein DD-endopeptidase MepM/ murein hydrolase activator NlpD
MLHGTDMEAHVALRRRHFDPSFRTNLFNRLSGVVNQVHEHLLDLVRIDHGGAVQTYYAHLSRINVHIGQEIRRGDVVGLVGSTGRVTAPHLHYEVRVGGAPMNPYRYLASAGVFHEPVKDFPF